MGITEHVIIFCDKCKKEIARDRREGVIDISIIKLVAFQTSLDYVNLADLPLTKRNILIDCIVCESCFNKVIEKEER